MGTKKKGNPKSLTQMKKKSLQKPSKKMDKMYKKMLEKERLQKKREKYEKLHKKTKKQVPLQRKVETITAFPPPQKAKSLLGFLGAINYYRRCLPNLGRQTAAEVLQPLYTAATQKQPGKSFKKIWEEEELDVHFRKAKELLGKAAGAALEQLTGGVWRPLVDLVFCDIMSVYL